MKNFISLCFILLLSISTSFAQTVGPSPRLSKLITITRDLSLATGSVSYTGVGFVPTTLIINGGLTGAGLPQATGTADSSRVGGGVSTFGAGSSVAANAPFFAAISGGVFQQGTISSYDTDGFTVAWSKSGAPTGTVTFYVLCLR